MYGILPSVGRSSILALWCGLLQVVERARVQARKEPRIQAVEEVYSEEVTKKEEARWWWWRWCVLCWIGIRTTKAFMVLVLHRITSGGDTVFLP
uniref:Putative secreted peptide n=1 Tax=Anopheles braziliensis TaxID=58242 RepID=A0A2M3ZVG2_9DIPT